MTPRFDLYVPGKPIPQGSMKGFVRKGKAGVPTVGITSNNPLLIQWRMKVTGYAMEKYGINAPLTGPVGIRLIFTLDRPQAHYLPVNRKRTEPVLRTDAPVFPAQAPDVDKLVRAIFDALTDAHLWQDDGQVVWCQATKVYADATYAAGVYLTVGEMQ